MAAWATSRRCLRKPIPTPNCTLAEDECYVVTDPSLAGWVFDTGFEMKLSRNDNSLFFGELSAIDETSFSYGDMALAPSNLSALHASKPKIAGQCDPTSGDSVPGEMSGKSATSAKSDHEPCDATVTMPPPFLPSGGPRARPPLCCLALAFAGLLIAPPAALCLSLATRHAVARQRDTQQYTEPSSHRLRPPTA